MFSSLLALFAIAPLAQQAGEAAPAEAPESLPVRLLRELSSGSTPSHAALLEDLVDEDGPALDALFAVVESGHLPRCTGELEACPHPAPGDQRRLAVLLDGLPALLVPRLAGPLGDLPSCSERVVALRVLAHTGDADDLHLSLDLATRPPEPTDFEWHPREVVRAVTDTVEGLLERDPRTGLALERAFDAVADELRSPLALAVGSVPSPEGLEFLVGELGRHAALDVTLLSQVGRIAGRMPAAADNASRMRLRSYLDDADVNVRREACNILGRVGDDESVLQLIELLHDGADSVRRSAHWALTQIAQRQIRPDPAHWLGWYEEETRWWSERAPDLRADLRSGDPAPVASALKEMAGRRLFRRELAQEVEIALDHSEPQIVRMACDALMALHSSAAVPALLQALEHRDAGVRASARQALVGLTGLDLGDQPGAWRARFGLPG